MKEAGMDAMGRLEAGVRVEEAWDVWEEGSGQDVAEAGLVDRPG
jgi:hypothetical protein